MLELIKYLYISTGWIPGTHGKSDQAQWPSEMFKRQRQDHKGRMTRLVRNIPGSGEILHPLTKWGVTEKDTQPQI